MTRKIINISSQYNSLYIAVREYPTHSESKLFRDKAQAETFLDMVKKEDLFQVK
jgi:hypothetical protein